MTAPAPHLAQAAAQEEEQLELLALVAVPELAVVDAGDVLAQLAARLLRGEIFERDAHVFAQPAQGLAEPGAHVHAVGDAERNRERNR